MRGYEVSDLRYWMGVLTRELNRKGAPRNLVQHVGDVESVLQWLENNADKNYVR